MHFQEISRRIDEEREAQHLRWGFAHDNANQVVDWIAFTRHQLKKDRQLHHRKLIVAGAMAVASIQAIGRRFNRPTIHTWDTFKHVQDCIERHAFVAVIHTARDEVVEDLHQILTGQQTWAELDSAMWQLLTKVFLYLQRDKNYKVLNNTDDPINPHWLITVNDKQFEIKAGRDQPSVTLTFQNIEDAIEALTSISHLDFVQR